MTLDKKLSNLKITPKLFHGKVLKNIRHSNDIVRIRISNPYTARNCKPGQFVNIRVSESAVPLLRRPFSINRVDRDRGSFDVLFQIIGRGTKLLAEFIPEQKINCLGPLGSYFRIDQNIEHAILIAGGLGIAPLEFLSQELLNKGIKVTLFWGNRSREPFQTCQFDLNKIECQFSTDDGSEYFNGTVTDLFETMYKKLQSEKLQIFSCGPTAMLKRIQNFAKIKNIPCQLSLEKMMACGFGVCMGCNVRSASDKDSFKYVCTDGPVFDSKGIELSD